MSVLSAAEWNFIFFLVVFYAGFAVAVSGALFFGARAVGSRYWHIG
jgi:hypothetical protein